MTARFSKKDIKRAGERIATAPDLASPEDVEIVNYWREVHKHPLQRLFESAGSIPGGLVAGRIKKYDTIVDKLRRDGTPRNLATMYDIAGCRVVLDDMESFENACSMAASLDGCNLDKSSNRDYIGSPRQSGYRCRHYIFKYEDDSLGWDLWAELQVRTAMQHAWATAVEMYDLATGRSRLKYDEKGTSAARFFLAASKLIAAHEEGGADGAVSAIRGELEKAESEAHVIEVLDAACEASSIISEQAPLRTNEYVLVDLNTEEQYLSISGVPAQGAVDEYISRERDGGCHNYVLVKASSIDQIKRAYPNYFGDISAFTRFVGGFIG